ncbi:phage tail protein [Tenacibaculum sp. FZY0031]|uniref:phage tail protein n=1 Tax=unclassified Tenacibaculum TaxID=2635139 RepID=UPI002EABFE3C|nr:phage tail protein [Tenacibaculum sp. FZY0031]
MANKNKAKTEDKVGKFPVGFYFSVSFDSSEGLPFQQVSGLTKEQTVEEVAGGGENRFKYRLPAVSVSKNLVLKRALVPKGDALTKWCKETIDGGLAKPIQTKTVSVNLLNKEGQVSMKWNFYKAYPIKYSISDLKSQESEVLIDTIELAYIHFTTS